jgi:ketosteroid isomerase-like protein
MSQENVEVIRTAFERFRSPEFFEMFAPDIEWAVRRDLPDAGVYHGHDGTRDVIARFDEVLDDIWMEPVELIAVDEQHVVAPLRWGGRGKGSGVEFEERRETWLFTVRDGRIVQITEFATREEAIEAAGLSE